jgi:hypothetical protein
MAVFASLLTLIVVAAAALTWVGVKTVRESRAGRSVSTVTDPALPGFEAFLEPTPTLLVLHVEDGLLISAAVMSLNSGDSGGSVLLLPAATSAGPEPEALTLSYHVSFAPEPADARGFVQNLLGLGIGEVAVVDAARWADLVAPVAPLTLTNPDAVGEFPAGEISLGADQVAAYLGASIEGQSDLARLARQEAFYEAWTAAVADSADPGAVPGELESGLGRFVRGLAAGPVQVHALPVTEVTAGDAVRIDPDLDAIEQLMPTVVPFPTAAAPGARVRLRLLDGTGDGDHVLRTAPLVVPAGAEIVVVGNADRFDYEITEIRYHVPLQKTAAESLRAALGAGRVIDDPRQTDAFDVTIVLGTDV